MAFYIDISKLFLIIQSNHILATVSCIDNFAEIVTKNAKKYKYTFKNANMD